MEKIYTPQAPEPIGPYSQAIKVGKMAVEEVKKIKDEEDSQAIKVGKMVFCSWQIWLKNWKLISDNIEEQTEQVCLNIKAVLKQAWLSLENVVKTTIYLTDIEDFPKVNKIYWKFFAHKPARSTVQVSALPMGAKIEIEVIGVEK